MCMTAHSKKPSIHAEVDTELLHGIEVRSLSRPIFSQSWKKQLRNLGFLPYFIRIEKTNWRLIKKKNFKKLCIQC